MNKTSEQENILSLLIFNSCAVRSAILKFKSEDMEGQEQPKVVIFMYSSFYLI